MSPVVLLAILVLVLLVIAAILGMTSLTVWLHHRTADFPSRKIVAHVSLQGASIAIWVVFLVTMQPWVAWVVFAVITVGQVFGDLLMFAGFRARHGVATVPSYLAVARDQLGFSRPVPALHAIVGALGWFIMLATCILSTLA